MNLFRAARCETYQKIYISNKCFANCVWSEKMWIIEMMCTLIKENKNWQNLYNLSYSRAHKDDSDMWLIPVYARF